MQIVVFMVPKTSIILDTRRALQDGTFPIKLRVTFNRTQKYFPTQFNATKADFDKYMARVPKGKEKQIRMALDSIEQKAISVIAELELFDFNKIKFCCQKTNLLPIINPEIYDCEHRYFHMIGAKINNAIQLISKEYLFPKYSGNHEI